MKKCTKRRQPQKDKIILCLCRRYPEESHSQKRKNGTPISKAGGEENELFSRNNVSVGKDGKVLGDRFR